MENIQNKKIVFIGGIGNPLQFGGEPTKNKEIINQLEKLGYELFLVDTLGSRNNLWKLSQFLMKFIYHVLFHRSATFIFSTSFVNIYGIIKLLYYYPIHINIIYWVIGGNFADRLQANWYDKKYLKKIKYFIVEGNKMKEKLKECNITNVFFKPNFKTVKSIPTVEKYNDGKIHFVFLSRIIPDKGVGYILDCVEKLNGNGYALQFEVDFYGGIDSKYKSEFSNRIDCLDNLHYCGELQLQVWDNYEKLARYHFMLFPTYWIGEGFPGVVIDSYISGVPILASDWNFNTEFIDNGHNGLIVPVHDMSALYETMLDIIRGKYNVWEMSKYCRKCAEKFDTNAVLTEEFIYKIVR